MDLWIPLCLFANDILVFWYCEACKLKMSWTPKFTLLRSMAIHHNHSQGSRMLHSHFLAIQNKVVKILINTKMKQMQILDECDTSHMG